MEWIVVGDLASVVQLTLTLKLIYAIAAAAKNARMHKRNCRQFAQHLKMIAKLLEQLKPQDVDEFPECRETREPLEHLEQCLRRALVLVENCRDKSYLYLIAMGWSIVAQFKEYQLEIDRYLRLIPLIALVENHREKLRAIEKDRREYTLEEDERRIHTTLLKDDRTRDDAVVLQRSLSRSYPGLCLDKALREENDKLCAELRRKQQQMDLDQCDVIEHLLEITKSVNLMSEEERTRLTMPSHSRTSTMDSIDSGVGVAISPAAKQLGPPTAANPPRLPQLPQIPQSPAPMPMQPLPPMQTGHVPTGAIIQAPPRAPYYGSPHPMAWAPRAPPRNPNSRGGVGVGGGGGGGVGDGFMLAHNPIQTVVPHLRPEFLNYAGRNYSVDNNQRGSGPGLPYAGYNNNNNSMDIPGRSGRHGSGYLEYNTGMDVPGRSARHGSGYAGYNNNNNAMNLQERGARQATPYPGYITSNSHSMDRLGRSARDGSGYLGYNNNLGTDNVQSGRHHGTDIVNHVRHQVADNGSQGGPRNWSNGLYDCCMDPFLCISTFLYPCGTFTSIAAVVSDGAMTQEMACHDLAFHALYLGCCCFTCCFRRKLRKRFNITGGTCDDCWAHIFCCCCSLVQEWREIQANEDEGMKESQQMRVPIQQTMTMENYRPRPTPYYSQERYSS